jgi:multidrug resistance efflux pump
VVDAYPDRVFEGVALALEPRTGYTFSLLPVNSATGPVTQIVRHVPVHIEVAYVEGGAKLRPGMSVTASVDLRTIFWPQRAVRCAGGMTFLMCKPAFQTGGGGH